MYVLLASVRWCGWSAKAFSANQDSDFGHIMYLCRVGVWEAAKWVAKIRDKTCTRCSSAVILQTNMSGGHFGEGGRFGQCEEAAYEYAFLMKVLGKSWTKMCSFWILMMAGWSSAVLLMTERLAGKCAPAEALNKPNAPGNSCWYVQEINMN